MIQRLSGGLKRSMDSVGFMGGDYFLAPYMDEKKCKTIGSLQESDIWFGNLQ